MDRLVSALDSARYAYVAAVTVLHYDIPDELHRRAKAAAAMQGVTLKAFILTAIERATDQAEGKSSSRRR